MRTETLWQGERRAARTQWWRQVLDRPASVANWGEVLDEMVRLRFGSGDDCSPTFGLTHDTVRAR